jgi:hypothetical protein
VSPKEQRVPLIDPGEPPPPPPPDLVDPGAEDDAAEELDDTDPTRPSSAGRRLPVGLPDGRTLDGEIIDSARVSPHAFRTSGVRLLDF